MKLFYSLIFTLVFSSLALAEGKKPNFIIIFTDDQGFQDLGCYGSPDIKTPRIDQMAAEGMKFNSFYAQTVCGPSRAALMTGCYPFRNARADNGVSPHPDLALSEITIAEVLKDEGYQTGIVGKWDLAGHSPVAFSTKRSPHYQGFDYSFWTPASNDSFVNLYEGLKLVEKKADMSQLTHRYTDKAIEFIDKNAQNPFFLYVAHTMPHTKLAVSDKFKGKSKAGLYGDVIEEIDCNVGRLLDHLKSKKLEENTYVIFTSDNGPWWIRKADGGHCDPLRGAKTSTYEGGFRVPCIIRAPGKVPAGKESNLVTSTIDLLPTIANLAGAEAPNDRTIDGLDISQVIHGTQDKLDRSFFYYQHKSLRAVRMGKWKLHLPHTKLDRQGEGRAWLKHVPEKDRPYIEELTLYNMEDDISETTNVAKEHPKVVEKLLAEIAYIKEDLGYQKTIGKNARR